MGGLNRYFEDDEDEYEQWLTELDDWRESLLDSSWEQKRMEEKSLANKSDGRLCSDPECSICRPVQKKEQSMLGTQFSTRNSTVGKLEEGTLLAVVGPGRLEVIEVPAPKIFTDYEAGDRINTKRGIATVFAVTSRIDVDMQGNDLLYVADNDSEDKVRAATFAEVSPR